MFRKINYANIPKHIAIIMDGNGRWALRRGFGVRHFGHSFGVKALKKVIKRAYELDVKTFTVYAFSTENWKREKQEIDEIFNLLLKFLKNYERELEGRKIAIKPLGDITKFPQNIQEEINRVEKETKENKKMTFYVGLNYGGRDEIVKACNKAIKAGEKEVTEKSFSNYLYVPEINDVDLIIRTSGEKRISNFLLWQGAYSEFYFSKKLWPAWAEKDLDKAIIDYQKRERRKGGTGK